MLTQLAREAHKLLGELKCFAQVIITWIQSLFFDSPFFEPLF
jgi:hypothetical protein